MNYTSPYSEVPTRLCQYWQADRDTLFTTQKKVLNIATIAFFTLFTPIWPLGIIEQVTLISKGKFARGTIGIVVGLICFVVSTTMLVNSTRIYFHRRKALASADHFVDRFRQLALRKATQMNIVSLKQMKPNFQEGMNKLVLEKITKDCQKFRDHPNTPYLYYLYPHLLTESSEKLAMRFIQGRLFNILG